MISSKYLFFLFSLCLPFLVASQNTLTIIVEGVESSEGYIAVGVYADQDNFLEEGKAFAGVFVKSKKGTTHIEIPNLPSGTYAISLFHDENGNKKLDTNFLGIPKEPLGFSIGRLKTFGPPSFDECAFQLSKSMKITVPVD